MSAGHDYSFKGKLTFISYGDFIYVFNEHFYVTQVQKQPINHYNIPAYIYIIHP